jgi:hypothetical protein
LVTALALTLGLTSASAAAPAITINSASAASYTSAHLSGKIDTSDLETSWSFQISTDGFTWSPAGSGTIPAGEGSTEVGVEADATGLEDGVTYFARLAASNVEESVEYFSAEPNLEFTTAVMAAPTVTIDEAAAVTGASAHFSGDISPETPSGDPPEFDVNWHFECNPECPGLVGGTIPADSSTASVEVEADATGLKPGVDYEVTLHASNAGNSVSAGPKAFTTLSVEPTLSAFSANPSYSEATLRGTIDPGGAETIYHFDYGSTAAYGQSTPPATIPGGNDLVKISAVVQGLSMAAGYHYRLVASNSAGKVDGGDKTFTTSSNAIGVDGCPNAAIRAAQGSGRLPECRAFELVNPPGLDVADVLRSPAISEDGDRAVWTSPVGPEDASATRVHYVGVATRGSSGWTNADASLPEGEDEGGDPSSKPSAFSTDLTTELYATSLSPDAADKNGTYDYYRFGVGSRGVGALWASPVDGTRLSLVGASRDLSRVVIEFSPASLSPLREIVTWDAANGARPVSVLPDGNLAENPVPGQYSHYPFWENLLGGAFPDIIAAHGGSHSVSNDGTKVFWIAVVGGGIGPLYMRDTATEETTTVSESDRPGEVGDAKPARLIAASPDGNVAFIQTEAPLTGESEVEAPNGGIYRVITKTGSKELVAPVHFDTSPAQELLAAIASDDASHLYFVTARALLPGAVEGKSNVYVWSGGSLKLLSVVGGEVKLERTSRDGRYMVFSTDAQVDGSTNEGQMGVFEYDAATANVACVSCRPDGSPSEGPSTLQAFPFATGGFVFPGPTRNITDDGRVFFSSTDRILPGDKTSAGDVYEYSHGAISLLTPGRGDANSYLLDNTDDGRNLFILTRAGLLPQDRDASELDLYDLRVGGGFPVEGRDIGASPCEGESCQGQPREAPPATAPASSSAANGSKGKHRKKKGRHRRHGSKGKRGKQRHTDRDRGVGR